MNIFDLGWKAFNRMEDIQRAVNLIQPTLQEYKNAPNLVDSVKITMDSVKTTMELAKPIIDQYSKVEDDFIPLINDLLNDFFPQQLKAFMKPLPKPTNGYDVKWLQESLNTVGIKINVDGDYGKKTRQAVKEYQKKLVDRKEKGWNKDDIDGWAGMKTCAVLYNDVAKIINEKKKK